MYTSLPLEKAINGLHSLGKAHTCSNTSVKLELLKIIIKLDKKLDLVVGVVLIFCMNGNVKSPKRFARSFKRNLLS